MTSMPPFDRVTLRTERLLLRPLRADDAAALFAAFSDAQVMRYWSTAPWTSIDRAHDIIARDAKAMAGGEWLRLGIETTGDGRLVGMCTLFDFHVESRRAQLGYAQASAVWGRGIMREALTALLGHGFGVLGLHRVEADVDPRNERSVRLLERLGFVQEGLLRERWIVAGEISHSALFGLLRAEWREQRTTG
jgi:ribosomal-protein-alanine N-acetyltransferase